MKLLILYTEYAGELRLLGVYSENYSLERRFKFKPIKRPEYPLDLVQKYFENSQVFFGKTFMTEKDLDENNIDLFGQKLFNALRTTPEDKVLLSLSITHRGNDG